jgi:predicted N-acetyltransferase YhbS
MIAIIAERDEHAAVVDSFLDEAFQGDTWRRKTCHLLRAGRTSVRGASLVAVKATRLVGTVRFWSVKFGRDKDGLMLGPLAVNDDARDGGVGAKLVRQGLEAARQAGHERVFLVGDAGYYERFGFTAAPMGNVLLPGTVDRRRLLGVELKAGAFEGVGGIVQAA